MTTIRPPLLIVALGAAFVLLPNLGGPPLWDEDEPRNAACSLAMHASGDWIVPTFNGRLRIEKPALVNWLHLAGFAVAGVNETGARLGSALLTIGTCMLTGGIAGRLFRPEVGIWAGLAMATCLWTAVAGRAATPDAPLAFFTTLALWLFVRGGLPEGTTPEGIRGPVRLPAATALGIGVACGLGILAKGPVGLALPLGAFMLFAWWLEPSAPERGTAGFGLASIRGRLSAVLPAWRGLRGLSIVAVAVAVAAPWYVLVGLRTDGEWLRGFLLVHNVGRFVTPMEGHSGSLLYYPVMLLVGTFPWSMAWIPAVQHAAGNLRRTDRPDERIGTLLLAAWLVAWLVPFTLAGTKLPGYIWPAYPALAGLTGLFVADWIRRPSAATDGWMRLGWACLAASGVALGCCLPFVAHRHAPGTEWLGLVGAVPLAGAIAAWSLQSRESRGQAAAVWATTAAATVVLLLGLGSASVGEVGGTRKLLADMPAGSPVGSFNAPASATFYAGRLTPAGTVTELADVDAAAAFVATRPGAFLVVAADSATELTTRLPADYRVLRSEVALPSSVNLLLVGPIAADGDTDGIAWNDPPRP